MNRRIYKIVTTRGSVHYATKTKDGRGSTRVDSIMQMASIIKRRLNKSLKEGAGLVSIDFSPFHDVEWANGRPPVRCLPLTDGEKEAFWLHFLKS